MSNKRNYQEAIKRYSIIGLIKNKELINILFFTGIVAVIYYSVVFGKYISIAYPYMKSIRLPDGMYTYIETNNNLLGFFAGVICIIITIVIWKVFCELLLLIFDALKAFSNQKDQEY